MIRTILYSLLTALFIAVCCGFMIFQKRQFDDLMQEYVDLKWQSGNTEANLVIARKQLQACRAADLSEEQK